MPTFDASNADCEYVQCAVCEKIITGGKWFARIKHGEWMVALCCPLSTEAFESKPHAYVRRIETLQFMRDTQSQSPLNE
jgi:hypothetical protein